MDEVFTYCAMDEDGEWLKFTHRPELAIRIHGKHTWCPKEDGALGTYLLSTEIRPFSNDFRKSLHKCGTDGWELQE